MSAMFALENCSVRLFSWNFLNAQKVLWEQMSAHKIVCKTTGEATIEAGSSIHSLEKKESK